MAHEKLDISNRSLDIVEKMQGMPGFLLLRRLFVRSQAEPYARVDAVVDLDDEKAELRDADPDPRANLLAAVFRRFLMTKSVVVGVPQESLDELILNINGKLAAAFSFDDVTRAAILPKGLNDLGTTAEDIRTVRMQQGPNKFGVGLGMLIPRERKLVLPRDTIIVASEVPVSRGRADKIKDRQEFGIYA